MIINPQPVWLSLLLLAAPGIFLLASIINAKLFPPGDRPISTIPTIALVLTILPTHFVALASGSLAFGAGAAWTGLSFAGYCWAARRPELLRLPNTIAYRQKAVAAIITSCPIIFLAVLYNFHDEVAANGHPAMIAHLQNGSYPPRYLYDPTLPLRYHYGFDLIAALISGILRIRPDQAIDLLTVALWPCLFLLLWRIGKHFTGKETAGFFVALTVSYAGGWPAICLHCSTPANPPFISYFFQHPWSLGTPIFCLVILLRGAVSECQNRALCLTMIACSLIALSLAQIVLFVSVIVALSASEAFRILRDLRCHQAWQVLIAMAVSMTGSIVAGGFFSGLLSSGHGDAAAFAIREYSASDFAEQVRWDAASFGLLLISSVAGISKVKRDQLVLVLLIVFPLIIMHVFRYRYSWDIVKFATAASIVMAISSGALLSDLFEKWAHRRACLLAVAALLMVPGLVYPLLASFFYRNDVAHQIIRPYLSTSYPIDQDTAGVISYLRVHMNPDDIVFRVGGDVIRYANWGGLPTQDSVFFSKSSTGDPYGFGKIRFQARIDLYTITPTWFDRASAQHIHWLVANAGDPFLDKILSTTDAQARSTLVSQFGKIMIYNIR